MNWISERVGYWVGGLLILGGVVGGSCEAEGFSPITVGLVSDSRAIAPGAAFTVAIHQKMVPGYHTYWRNAGTLGLPTGVEWDLPDGFVAGEIQWPIPVVTRMAQYRVWGYQGEVLLLTTLTAPASLKPGETIEIKGAARWMCCGRQCFPSGGTRTLALPVRTVAEPNPEWVEAFQAVRDEQPESPERWELSASVVGNDYELRVLRRDREPGIDPGQLEFFGYDRVVSSDKGQTVKREGEGFQLTLQAEEFSGTRTNRLRGILVAEKGWGAGSKSRAMAVDVPLGGVAE